MAGKVDKSVFFAEELWQTQRWFPITGWMVTAKGQYESLRQRVFDNPPGDEILPEGMTSLSCFCFLSRSHVKLFVFLHCFSKAGDG